MAKKNLNKQHLTQFEDWYGNNAAVRCPVCGKVFIVSGFIAKGKRKCPNCQKTTAQITPDRVTIEWLDPEDEPQVRTRGELETDGRLDKCVRLVSEGGAVDYRSIEAKLPRVKRMALVQRGDEVIAVAAIKSPSPQYAATLRKKTGYPLLDDFPELGYVAVACEWRGLGLSQKVMEVALSGVDSWRIFATTSSPLMKRTLTHGGFLQVGNEYVGKDARYKLSLWVRDDKTGIKAPLDADEQAIVDKAIASAAQSGFVMEPHQCFRNTQAVFAADHTDIEGSRKLRYHEGYAPISGAAAPHAWLTINGKIVDVTLQQAVNREQIISKIGYYLADIVPTETVLSHFTEGKKHKGYGSIRGLRLTPRENL